MKTVCMLGSGAFGTAFSSLLAGNGFEVNMWCHDQSVADEVSKNHCNKLYLPNLKLSKQIKPFTNIQHAMEGVTWVFEATPVKFLRSVLEKAKPYVRKNQNWIILSKGIENKTLLFPSQMLADIFDISVKKAVISGPSFAKDLSAKQVTGVALASDDQVVAQELATILQNNYFVPHVTSDMIGVQVGGALKNIMALAIGMLDGAGFTDNTKSLLLTTGLDQMVLFAEHLGGKPETLYGLSGLGDVVLTCMGSLSRNLMVGKRLGLGEKLDDVIRETGIIPEGVNTVKSVYEIINKERFDHLPLFESVYEIIFGNKTVEDLIKILV